MDLTLYGIRAGEGEIFIIGIWIYNALKTILIFNNNHFKDILFIETFEIIKEFQLNILMS